MKRILLLLTGLITVATACERTIEPGQPLATGDQCVSLIGDHAENRPVNKNANERAGTARNGRIPRVDGKLSGKTTEETIEWAACKWGIDRDWAKAQIWKESFWQQGTLGDFTTDRSACVPGKPIGNYPPQYNGDRKHTNECPESIGLGQVRWRYHSESFKDGNAVNSSAYNVDYTYGVWRSCYEGEMTWLNTVDGRGDYKAGDMLGCMGVWFSGRWYTPAARQYIDAIKQIHDDKPWQTKRPATNTTTPAPPKATTTTTTAPKRPVAPTTTVAPPTTVAPTTTVRPTTTTTTPPSARPNKTSAFVETFDGNSGLNRFKTGVYHRDPHLVAQTEWTGDHDRNCGSPDTQRVIHRNRPDEAFYVCRDHLMTSVGDTSGYSTAWFSPKQTFNAERSISFDVNSTFLGRRQWWEVSLVPADFDSGVKECPQCSAESWLPANLPSPPKNSLVLGAGPFGQDPPKINGKNLSGDQICGSYSLDPEGCASKAIRRTWTLTDNGNGTVTVTFLDNSWTVKGSFPKGDWNLVFKDHNYTPNKDGMPVGHTWHWDNIVVG